MSGPRSGTLRETIARLWYVQSEPGEVECKRCHTWGDPGRTDWHEPTCPVVLLFACADAWAASERYIKAVIQASGPCDWDCTPEEYAEYEAALAAREAI